MSQRKPLQPPKKAEVSIVRFSAAVTSRTIIWLAST